ncbi:MAG: hypothetical protein HC859_15900 [Bacteroidia bacterium]|nr:hypothetical protein [Bacteroidia bacterium]
MAEVAKVGAKALLAPGADIAAVMVIWAEAVMVPASNPATQNMNVIDLIIVISKWNASS